MDVTNCTECLKPLSQRVHNACFAYTPPALMLSIRAVETRKLTNRKTLMSQARAALAPYLPKPIPAMPRPQRDDWAEDYFKPWLADQPKRKSRGIEE